MDSSAGGVLVGPAEDDDVGSCRARFSHEALEKFAVKERQTVLIHDFCAGQTYVCTAGLFPGKPQRLFVDDTIRKDCPLEPHRKTTVEPIPMSAARAADAAIFLQATTPYQVAAIRSLFTAQMILIPKGMIEIRDPLSGQHVRIKVTGSDEFLFVTTGTRFVPSVDKPSEGSKRESFKSSSPSRSCNGKALQLLVETINLPVSDLLELRSKPPRGVLISGPPGVGKTSAVFAAARETGSTLFQLDAQSQAAKSTIAGAVEKQLRDLFEEAREDVARSENGSAIIFIDEIDALCAKRSRHRSSEGHRGVTQLLGLMDGVASNPQQAKILVVGATNRPNELDDALRRPGRFDYELALRAPAELERSEILRSLLGDSFPFQVSLYGGVRTSGYVQADLAALGAECIRAKLQDGADKLEVRHLDLALEKVPGSILRSPFTVADDQDIYWSNIAGSEEAKHRLQIALEWPMAHQETWKHLGMQPSTGVLLHGPPGTCKTTLVRTAVYMSHSSLISLSGAEIYSSYFGEAERIVREVFATARSSAPCVLFLDEVDALVGKRGGPNEGNMVRERVLSTFLTEMDGVNPTVGVLVVGATNRIDLIDSALLRPGRFGDIIAVGLPDKPTREEIFKLHTNRMDLGPDVDFSLYAEQTEGFSGADISGVCREAGMSMLRNRREESYDFNVMHSHFEKALCEARKRTTGATAPATAPIHF